MAASPSITALATFSLASAAQSGLNRWVQALAAGEDFNIALVQDGGVGIEARLAASASGELGRRRPGAASKT